MLIWGCKRPIVKMEWFQKEFMTYPHLIMYDFETILAPLNEHPTDFDLFIKTYTRKHCYLVSGNLEGLIEQLLKILTEK